MKLHVKDIMNKTVGVAFSRRRIKYYFIFLWSEYK